jgi:hypothetical protein
MLAQWKTVTSCTRPGEKSNEAQIFLIPVMPNTATPKLKQDQHLIANHKYEDKNFRQKSNQSLPTQKTKIAEIKLRRKIFTINTTGCPKKNRPL